MVQASTKAFALASSIASIRLHTSTLLNIHASHTLIITFLYARWQFLKGIRIEQRPARLAITVKAPQHGLMIYRAKSFSAYKSGLLLFSTGIPMATTQSEWSVWRQMLKIEMDRWMIRCRILAIVSAYTIAISECENFILHDHYFYQSSVRYARIMITLSPYPQLDGSFRERTACWWPGEATNYHAMGIQTANGVFRCVCS